MLDLVVEGNVYLEGNIVKCCVGIENGKITAIKKILKGIKSMDFGEKLILPSGIDAHVHFRDPGQTHKEDFESGTISAGFGGITCVIDMPNTVPPVISLSSFLEKLNNAKRRAYIDFDLYCGVSSRTSIQRLAKVCSAFKVYMASTTGELLITNDKTLKKKLDKIGIAKKIAAVHCEDEGLRKELKPKNLREYSKARPPELEVRAIEKLKSFDCSARIHVCHISSMKALEAVRHSEFTCEVTPHHLFLNSESHLKAFGKVNPPLRSKDDQFALWNGIINNEIDILASDHAPHTIEEKEDFLNAPPGMPGVETMLPLMLYSLKQGRISLERLVSLVSEKPSQIFSINKGRIRIGSDGDLIAVDMRDVSEIKGEKLHYKCRWTPFEGFRAIFPIAVVCRGELIVKGGNLEGERGFGEFVRGQ